MIARHGKDFAIGAFVLSAKFIAEGKPLINRTSGGGETVSDRQTGLNWNCDFANQSTFNGLKVCYADVNLDRAIELLIR